MEKFTVFVSRPDWLDQQTGTGINLWPVFVEAETAREAADKGVEKVIKDDVVHGWITEEEADDDDGYQAQITIRGHVDIALWGWEI